MRELLTATTAHSCFVKENQISQHRLLVDQKSPTQDRESAGFSVDIEHHAYEICIKNFTLSHISQLFQKFARNKWDFIQPLGH